MLYIIRHGKTDWNALYKLQGKTDIPLNEEGRRMALRAGKECKDINFDICFSSPLSRAIETAKIMLQGRDIEIITDKRLEEMSFGNYEGCERVIEEHTDLPIAKFFLAPEEYTADNGAESFEELFSRTGDFLRERVLPLLNEGKDVLIVGHGAMNCSLICQLKGYEIKDFWKDMTGNCKLMTIDRVSQG